ncbi:MAG: histidine phosphatase family protein [Hyphomicrobiaceae bacterium]
MFYTAGSGDDSVGSGQMRFEKRHENSAVGLAWRGLALAVLACSIGEMVALVPSAYADDHKLWAALKQGEAFAIMRHALAPGVGDPDNFSVEDCATQRNLSADGRAQARVTGERFRRNGVKTARDYSSAWCRCKDTAALLGLGKVEVLDKLNSFFQDYGQRAPQTAAFERVAEECALVTAAGFCHASGEHIGADRTADALRRGSGRCAPRWRQAVAGDGLDWRVTALAACIGGDHIR